MHDFGRRCKQVSASSPCRQRTSAAKSTRRAVHCASIAPSIQQSARLSRCDAGLLLCLLVQPEGRDHLHLQFVGTAYHTCAPGLELQITSREVLATRIKRLAHLAAFGTGGNIRYVVVPLPDSRKSRPFWRRVSMGTANGTRGRQTSGTDPPHNTPLPTISSVACVHTRHGHSVRSLLFPFAVIFTWFGHFCGSAEPTSGPTASSTHRGGVGKGTSQQTVRGRTVPSVLDSPAAVLARLWTL